MTNSVFSAASTGFSQSSQGVPSSIPQGAVMGVTVPASSGDRSVNAVGSSAVENGAVAQGQDAWRKFLAHFGNTLCVE